MYVCVCLTVLPIWRLWSPLLTDYELSNNNELPKLKVPGRKESIQISWSGWKRRWLNLGKISWHFHSTNSDSAPSLKGGYKKVIEAQTSSWMHSRSGGRSDFQEDIIAQPGGLCIWGVHGVQWDAKAVRATILPDGEVIFELIFKR